MKIFLLPLFLVFLLDIVGAQNCNEAALLQKPGIWKESSGGGTGITAADMAKEKKVVAAIHSMIKSRYTPKGVIARFNGSYNRLEPDMMLNTFYYSIIPLNYYCDGNVMKTADETSTDFQISANTFEVDIYDSAQGDRALAEGFNFMHDLPVEKDGYWYFKDRDVTLGFGLPGKRSMSLITFAGKLPFGYVTKKEFLQKRKQSLWADMQKTTSSLREDLKNIELAKGYTEKELKNDPDKLIKYMQGYHTSKDKFEKLLANNEKNYKPALDKIESQLKMPSEELNQTAIVKLDPKATLSTYVFSNDDDPFGEILIKPNPVYFNKKLPRSSPQFFWVAITWNPKEPTASKFREDIMKAIDFTTLKNMLGK